MVKLSKDIAAGFLSDVPYEKEFIVCDGTRLKNLEEASAAISAMEDNVFCFHVNKDKNDLYNWIREVLRDTSLASSIRKIKTKKSMAEKIRARVLELQKVS